MTQLHRVAVVGGGRTPLTCSSIVCVMASSQEMLTSALEGPVERYNPRGERLGEVVTGVMPKRSRDFNLIHEHVLGSRLAPETPTYDTQQACDTGLKVVILAANKIALGQIDSSTAGGISTTSDAPTGVSEGLHKIFLETDHGRSNLDELKSLLRIHPRHVVPVVPRNGEPRTGLLMRESCELMAQTWQIPRDEQDRLVFESHHELVVAYGEGWQNDLITPFRGLACDQNLRPDIDLEKIGAFKPAFECGSRSTLTAANPTPLTDGALVALLASEEWAKARGLPILVCFKDGKVAAVNLVGRQEDLLMTPVCVMPQLLVCNGLNLQDFDYYGIHEAFAARVLCTLRAWEDPEYHKARLGFDQLLDSIDRNKLDIKSSLLAVGHPFAATGGRIVANLTKLLLVTERGRGPISIYAVGR